MREAKILLLDCNPSESTGETLESILANSSLQGSLRRQVSPDVSQIDCDLEWLNLERGDHCGLIIIILPSPRPMTAVPLIQSIRTQKPEAPIIVVSEDCCPDETLELLRHGVSDFITPPLRSADTLARTWRLLDRFQSQATDARRKLVEKIGLKFLIGKASGFLAEVEKIPLIAQCDSRTLIIGETGTGKELCARAIHYLSPRNGKPFVPVNCGAIPIELVENELFGHERGAFTGAHAASKGVVEEAEGGTLFLDEIDCLSLMAQVKLLRFLQDKEYRRLGSAKIRHADVRVIVASNAALEEAMHQGRIRQDLYYRLNVVSLALPPLRDRHGDLPLLAQHFLEKYAADLRKEVTAISPGAMRKLALHDWPGNVRELEHTMERAVMFSQTAVLTEAAVALPAPNATRVESFRQTKAKFVEQFEREYIQHLLLACNGNISRAAQTARKNRRAFWELIRKYRIDVRSFKMGES